MATRTTNKFVLQNFLEKAQKGKEVKSERELATVSTDNAGTGNLKRKLEKRSSNALSEIKKGNNIVKRRVNYDVTANNKILIPVNRKNQQQQYVPYKTLSPEELTQDEINKIAIYKKALEEDNLDLLKRPLTYLESPEKILGDIGMPGMETSENDRLYFAQRNNHPDNANMSLGQKMKDTFKYGLNKTPGAALNLALASLGNPEGSALRIVGEAMNPIPMPLPKRGMKIKPGEDVARFFKKADNLDDTSDLVKEKINPFQYEAPDEFVTATGPIENNNNLFKFTSGKYPTNTKLFDYRNISTEIPKYNPFSKKIMNIKNSSILEDNLSKELEPYISRIGESGISREEEVFRNLMGHEYRSAKELENTIFLDPEGNIISGSANQYIPYVDDMQIKEEGGSVNIDEKDINAYHRRKNLIKEELSAGNMSKQRAHKSWSKYIEDLKSKYQNENGEDLYLPHEEMHYFNPTPPVNQELEQEEMYADQEPQQQEQGGMLYADRNRDYSHEQTMNKYMFPEQTLMKFMKGNQKQNGGLIPFHTYYQQTIINSRNKS